jgi:Bacterial mobilisation protein (MobC)
MSDRVHLTTWLDRASKTRFGVIAQARGLSESALLRELVESTLKATGAVGASAPEPILPAACSGRISVRLRTDDLLFLRERASARKLPTSTYVSLLVRSHLRAQTPLPTAELEALKRSVAEVGAMGRNINQIARAVNQQQWPAGPNHSDLVAILRALTGLRENFKAVISANLTSWDTGHETADRRPGKQ